MRDLLLMSIGFLGSLLTTGLWLSTIPYIVYNLLKRYKYINNKKNRADILEVVRGLLLRLAIIILVSFWVMAECKLNIINQDRVFGSLLLNTNVAYQLRLVIGLAVAILIGYGIVNGLLIFIESERIERYGRGKQSK